MSALFNLHIITFDVVDFLRLSRGNFFVTKKRRTLFDKLKVLKNRMYGEPDPSTL